MEELKKEIAEIELVLSMIPRGETEVPLTINLDQMSPKVRVYINYNKTTLLTKLESLSKKFDTKDNLCDDLVRSTIASNTGAQEPGMYFLCHD